MIYKKSTYQNLVKLSLLPLTLFSISSCLITGNCYRVGYSQEIESTFVSQVTREGYFVYSYLQDKNSKNYSVYSLSLDGKAKKILDLGTKNYDTQKYFNYDISHEFTSISNNKLLMNENIRDANQKSSYFNYLIDPQTGEIIYKTESKGNFSTSKISNDKRYILDSDKTIFDIEKGKYISNSENYILGEWIGISNYIFSLDYQKEVSKISIYEIKESKINKVVDYSIKDSELTSYVLKPFSFNNNVLEFLSVNRSDKTNKTENMYQLDFSKKEITLFQEALPRVDTDREERLVLGASKKIYLEEVVFTNNGRSREIIKKTSIFDYLNELPKGFYSDQLLCGNYATTDKLDKY